MRLNKLLMISCLLFLIYGCVNEKESVGLDIEEDKMVDIMMDLRVIENQINKHHVLDRDSVTALYKDMLFKIHEIDSVRLSSNLLILQNNPRLSKEIEDRVLKKIAKRQEKLRGTEDE